MTRAAPRDALWSTRRRWRRSLVHFHLDWVRRGVVHHGRALVQDLVEVPPHERQEQDVLPALHYVLIRIDGFQIASPEAQEGFEQVAVARAEFQAAAVDDLAAFADESLLDRVGAE